MSKGGKGWKWSPGAGLFISSLWAGRQKLRMQDERVSDGTSKVSGQRLESQFGCAPAMTNTKVWVEEGRREGGKREKGQMGFKVQRPAGGKG